MHLNDNPLCTPNAPLHAPRQKAPFYNNCLGAFLILIVRMITLYVNDDLITQERLPAVRKDVLVGILLI